ncbi:MAG: thiamine phosphate synthase [Pseudomonadota bacterium]
MPRLYLVSPELDHSSAAEGFAEAITASLRAGDVACLLLHGTDGAAAQRLRDNAHAQEVAALWFGKLADSAGFDGLHLEVSADDAARQIKAARQALGADAIVGAGCGFSKHAGMVAGEAGADYVAFGTLENPPTQAHLELISWWREAMEIPSIGLGAASEDDCVAWAQAGADFIAVGPAFWQEGADAAEIVTRINTLIGGCEGP